MRKYRILKALRVVISLVTLGVFLAAFSSLAVRAGLAAKAEFLPALLRTVTLGAMLSLAAFLLIAVGTLMFGRFYCSLCCPLGVLQDIAARVGALCRYRPPRYKVQKNRWPLRYGALIVLGCLAVGGWLVPLGWLEPYTLFGRNAAGPGQALLVQINNWFYGRFDSVIPMAERPAFPIVLAVAAGVTLLAVLLVAAWRGRLFCNTLCPTGALLGLLSRRSVYHLRLDRTKCLKCAKCVKVCKAGCIDLKQGILDSERCVDCLNCLTVCGFQAIKPGRVLPLPVNAAVVAAPEVTTTVATPAVTTPSVNESGYAPGKDIMSENGAGATVAPAKVPAVAPASALAVPASRDPRRDFSRRDFVAIAGVAGAASLLGGRFIKRREPALPLSGRPPIMPPGALDRDKFLSRCTGCGLCVANCAGQTLAPAFMEYGLGGMGQPRLSFRIGKCEFDCNNCSNLCPTGALTPLTMEQKHRCRVGDVKYFPDQCVVVLDETSCGACAEHCPTGALQMVPYKDDLTIPEVIPELCIGCGSCQYICPAEEDYGNKAIMVFGLAQQQVAADPREVLKIAEPGDAPSGSSATGSAAAEQDGFPF